MISSNEQLSTTNERLIELYVINKINYEKQI